jgi:hypothetical protein
VAELEPVSLPDDEIYRSIEWTVRDVLLPALGDHDPWARAAAVQLAGLARYAATRGPDATRARLDELTELLASMGDNAIVAEVWDGDTTQRSVMAAVGSALAGAVGRHDEHADQVRERLRPVVVRQLDAELDETAPLVDAFRGKLDG